MNSHHYSAGMRHQPSNVASDSELAYRLEPTINQNKLEPSKNPEGENHHEKSLAFNNDMNKSPPPLPNVPSSSDIYTKKIANFKRKLKTLKGISTLDIRKTSQSTIKGNKQRCENNCDKHEVVTSMDDRVLANVLTIDNNVTNFPTCFSRNSFDTSSPKLQCGHMTHEECLLMEIELSLTLSKTFLENQQMLKDFFPPCGSCPNNVKAAKPKEEDIMTRLFTRLITSEIIPIRNSIISNQTPTTPLFSDTSKILDQSTNSILSIDHKHTDYTNHLEIENYFDMPSSVKSTGKSFYGEENNENTNTSKLKKNIEEQKHSKKSYKTHRKKPSRGSYVSATSAIVTSSSSTNNIKNEAAKITYNGTPTIGEQKFIEDLVKLSNKNIIESTDDANFKLTLSFVKSLGKLILVDKLNALESINGKQSTVTEKYCYLFEHMLITISSKDYIFSMFTITHTTYVYTQPRCITMQACKSSASYCNLLFDKDIVFERWAKVLTDRRKKMEIPEITLTMHENEFDSILSGYYNDVTDVETIGTLQSYIGDDGYRRLPTGVCPRFYEGNIDSLVFHQKPTKAIIIINEAKHIPSSVVPIKNIVKSLSLIGIDILLLLCSTSALSMDSNVHDSCELNKKDYKGKIDMIMDKIDDFQNFLLDKSCNTVKSKVEDIINDQLSDDIDSTISIVISSSTLNNFGNVSTYSKILMEVGLDGRHKSKRDDIDDDTISDIFMDSLRIAKKNDQDDNSSAFTS
ncbi:Signal recognition particle receptor FtsY [Pichia kudriavzevii]|uniref:Signal recognition particle receptor FtsY n=1 Tax=Pichia kudriavzevii TaxID=4909 RepID=A0A1V2LQG1_PICKU|nr:Signal recognition particle receptor FtsY [Pichia kudriavzevii]